MNDQLKAIELTLDVHDLDGPQLTAQLAPLVADYTDTLGIDQSAFLDAARAHIMGEYEPISSYIHPSHIRAGSVKRRFVKLVMRLRVETELLHRDA